MSPTRDRERRSEDRERSRNTKPDTPSSSGSKRQQGLLARLQAQGNQALQAMSETASEVTSTPVPLPPKALQFASAMGISPGDYLYQVQKGENLSVLSKKHGVSIETLKNANQDKLKRWGDTVGFNAGEIILIPDGSKPETATWPEDSSSIGSGGFDESDASGTAAVMKRVRRYDDHIADASAKFDIPEKKIRAIIATESAGRPKASSGSAYGLMQLTKNTWEGVRTRVIDDPNLSTKTFSTENWQDPRTNIMFGTAAFKNKMDAIDVEPTHEKSVSLAMVAYNAGQATVNRAIQNAKDDSSKTPKKDALKPEYLKPAIRSTGVYTYYTEGEGASMNESGTVREAVQLKYDESAGYPKKINTYLDYQEEHADDSTETETEPSRSPAERTEAHYQQYSDDKIGMVELGKRLKPFASSDGSAVIDVLQRLPSKHRDNLSYALANNSTSEELATFDRTLLNRMQSHLGGWTNTLSWGANWEQAERVQQALDASTREQSDSSGGTSAETPGTTSEASGVANDREDASSGSGGGADTTGTQQQETGGGTPTAGQDSDGGAVAGSATESASIGETERQTYDVQQGDTFTEIAGTLDTVDDWRTLYNENKDRLGLSSPRDLDAEDTLVIPGTRVVTSGQTEKTADETQESDDGPSARVDALYEQYTAGAIDMIGLANGLKPFAASNGALVLDMLDRLPGRHRDNLSYAMANNSTVDELTAFERPLLQSMAAALGGWTNTMSWGANWSQQDRVEEALRNQQERETDSSSEAADGDSEQSYEERVNEAVRQTISDELTAYLNLEVTVGDVSVEVQPTYYQQGTTNRPSSDAFSDVVESVDEEESLIQHVGGHSTRTQGQAVRAGKSTPSDLEAVIQQAIDDGTITAFARREHDLADSMSLEALEKPQIRTIVQSWVNTYKVGVDCSGLALNVLVKVRQRQIELAQEAREAGEDVEIPDQPTQGERNAAHFQAHEPTIDDPRNLAAGHFWVMADGGHIRVVSKVEDPETVDGQQVITFETMESEGSEAVVEREWTIPLDHVDSLADDSDTEHITGPDVAGGTFHSPQSTGSHPGNVQ